ncbi:hypothetical protein ACFXCZ_35450 [Streptomyces sp. NPDC059396]|uniref:hypothetical protein n=1 Tax=Streptomyces sp. NPDC059396 TaxID=3346819 RepID=UPI0036BCE50C
MGTENSVSGGTVDGGVVQAGEVGTVVHGEISGTFINGATGPIHTGSGSQINITGPAEPPAANN